MRHTPGRAPRRGSTAIKKIVITGFESPLIVENGKHIKNWTPGLRERLVQEAAKLANLAEQTIQQRILHSSNNTSGSFPEVEESVDQPLTWECSNRDGGTVDMETDPFIMMNEEPWVFTFSPLPPE
jgi:hypothetical protein